MTKKTKTFEDAWGEYKTACFPGGISPVQDQELRRAFYAGALTLVTTGSTEDDTAILVREVITYLRLLSDLGTCVPEGKA